MGLVHYLQHWLSGTGAPLHVADFVPDTHPLRQWADTFPWAALVAAIEHSVSTKPLARKCTLCSPRPSASFVAVSTRRSWMN
jgi:hypothetical protein